MFIKLCSRNPFSDLLFPYKRIFISCQPCHFVRWYRFAFIVYAYIVLSIGGACNGLSVAKNLNIKVFGFVLGYFYGNGNRNIYCAISDIFLDQIRQVAVTYFLICWWQAVFILDSY